VQQVEFVFVYRHYDLLTFNTPKNFPLGLFKPESLLISGEFIVCWSTILTINIKRLCHAALLIMKLVIIKVSEREIND